MELSSVNTEFRYLLVRISKRLRHEDCEGIKYVHGLPEPPSTTADLGLYVLSQLEAEGFYDPLNPEKLQEILSKIGRKDLAHDIKDYKQTNIYKRAVKLENEREKEVKKKFKKMGKESNKRGEAVHERHVAAKLLSGVDTSTTQTERKWRDMFSIALTQTAQLVDQTEQLRKTIKLAMEQKDEDLNDQKIQEALNSILDAQDEVESLSRNLRKAVSAAGLKSRKSSQEGLLDASLQDGAEPQVKKQLIPKSCISRDHTYHGQQETEPIISTTPTSPSFVPTILTSIMSTPPPVKSKPNRTLHHKEMLTSTTPPATKEEKNMPVLSYEEDEHVYTNGREEMGIYVNIDEAIPEKYHAMPKQTSIEDDSEPQEKKQLIPKSCISRAHTYDGQQETELIISTTPTSPSFVPTILTSIMSTPPPVKSKPNRTLHHKEMLTSTTPPAAKEEENMPVLSYEEDEHVYTNGREEMGIYANIDEAISEKYHAMPKQTSIEDDSEPQEKKQMIPKSCISRAHTYDGQQETEPIISTTPTSPSFVPTILTSIMSTPPPVKSKPNRTLHHKVVKEMLTSTTPPATKEEKNMSYEEDEHVYTNGREEMGIYANIDEAIPEKYHAMPKQTSIEDDSGLGHEDKSWGGIITSLSEEHLYVNIQVQDEENEHAYTEIQEGQCDNGQGQTIKGQYVMLTNTKK